ncbi:MAG: helix-turn-helix transcriptional regulator [Lentisphaeria bacterium]
MGASERPDFSARLREARRAAGLSLTGTARLLGVHWQTVASWEHGRRTPPVSAPLTQPEILRRLEVDAALRTVAAPVDIEDEDDY